MYFGAKSGPKCPHLGNKIKKNMLHKVQGRIGYVKKDLVHQHKRIPPGNQENIMEEKKNWWVFSVSKAFSKIQQQRASKELTVILSCIVWRLELKMTGSTKEQQQ